jgi:ATP-dependent Clp protease ATP-binding subunit ClpA
MRRPYSKKSRQAIFVAHRIVAASSAADGAILAPEHLLAGVLIAAPDMLKEPTASSFLQALGLPPDDRVADSSVASEVRFDAATQKVLSEAALGAERLSSESIRPEHLLLALLQDSNSAAERLLQGFGATAAAVTARLRGQPDEDQSSSGPAVILVEANTGNRRRRR